MNEFDVVVIGAGSGLTVSSNAAAQGLDVAVIEPGPFGGTCLNRGCIPSKILVHTADVATEIQEADQFNLKASLDDVDFPGVVNRTFEHIDESAANIAEGNKENDNITVYNEYAEFVDERTLQVGDETVKGDNVVVAAGSRPVEPPIQGLDSVDYYTSADIMRIEEQPDSLTVIGGGYIAAELGYVFSALGTDVTIIEMSDTLVGNEDTDIQEAFTDIFSRDHNVLLERKATAVEETGDGTVTVTVEDKDGETDTVESDALLLAAGRRPNTDTLNVEAGNIETDDRGFINTNEYLETTADKTWALGDIAGNWMFKHSANLEAGYVWQNAFTDGEKHPVDYTAMPHAIFSRPQVAGVGKTEQALEDTGASYAVGIYEYADTGFGMALQEEDGFVKVLADPETKEILGCHILGPHASQLIHEVIIAMKAGSGTVDDILGSVHIHPALNEVVQRAFRSIDW